MACQHPLWIRRRRYTNPDDPMTTFPCPPKDGIPVQENHSDNHGWYVPCGKCFDCCKRKKQDWYLRVRGEMERGIRNDKTSGRGYNSVIWCSFTFDDDHLPQNKEELSAAIRRFKDNLRKKLGYFPKHWFITELGHETHRLHLHGFIYMRNFTRFELIRESWLEGFCWLERCKSTAAISYAVKYVFKSIIEHFIYDNLAGKIYCSLGFGRGLYNDYAHYIFNYGGDDYNRVFKKDGFPYAFPRRFFEWCSRQFNLRKRINPEDPDPPESFDQSRVVDYLWTAHAVIAKTCTQRL